MDARSAERPVGMSADRGEGEGVVDIQLFVIKSQTMEYWVEHWVEEELVVGS